MNKPIQLYLAAKTCLHVRYSKIIAKKYTVSEIQKYVIGTACSFSEL